MTILKWTKLFKMRYNFGVLLGTRKGDQFFTFDGEVLQADSNAARNVETRLDDPNITRFMKSIDVRKVLIKRTASFLLQRDLTLQTKEL